MPTRRILAASMVSPTTDHLPDTRVVQGRIHSPDEVDRVLYVPRLPASDGAPHHAGRAESEGSEVLCYAKDHGDVYLLVSYEASPPYGFGTCFELGLHEQYRLPQLWCGRAQTFERDRQGDKRKVGHEEVGLERQILPSQPAHVGPLHNGDARVVTQRPVELAVADIDRQHPLCSSLQENVGKSSRRCSRIDARASLHPHAKPVDSRVEFLAGARDEAIFRVDKEGFAWGDAQARLGHDPVANSHAAGEDKTLGPAPALGETPLDEQGVQPLAGPLRATLHTSRLARPVTHEIRELQQGRSVSVDPRERGDGPLRRPVGLPRGAFETEDTNERSLTLLGVGSRTLAELLPGRCGVEDVVDYLEAEAELRSVLRDRGLLRFGRTRQYRTDAGRGLDQGAGLVLVDHIQSLRLGLFGTARLVHVHDLSPDHPVDPRRAGQLPHDLDDLLAATFLVDCDQGQGLSEEGVASEDGHGLAELLVGGRPSPPVVIVVHRRKIVVDQRVGVDELYGGRGREDVGGFGATDPGHLHAQRRPHALAAGEHGVPHGLLESLQPRLCGESEASQVLLEGAPVRLPSDLALRPASLARHALPYPAPAVPRHARPPLRMPAPRPRRNLWLARSPRLQRRRGGRHRRRASRRGRGAESNGPPCSCGARATPPRLRRELHRDVPAPPPPHERA